MVLSQSKIFGKQKKKLFPNQIDKLDKALKAIIANPTIGTLKKGDIHDIRVYKFKMFHQEYLLAYTLSKTTIFLLSLGTHENFYRDLKKAF